MTQVIQKGSNVVDLLQYRKPMKNPVLVEMLEYWERLRDGRTAPLRSEIDPREIENALEHAFILERAQQDQVRFRIAGMALCDLMGMEVRGMPAASVFTPQSRAAFSAIVAQVFCGPEIVELHLEPACPGAKSLSAQMLLLPLKSDRGDISRILGCLVSDPLNGAPPHRFVLTGKKVTRIIATGQAQQQQQTVAGFAESADVFQARPAVPIEVASHPAAATNPGFLRLVKTED